MVRQGLERGGDLVSDRRVSDQPVWSDRASRDLDPEARGLDDVCAGVAEDGAKRLVCAAGGVRMRAAD
jgi:hypothetical protein